MKFTEAQLDQALRDAPAILRSKVLEASLHVIDGLVISKEAYRKLFDEYWKNPAPPSIPKMMLNFAEATARWAAAGFPVVTEEQLRARLDKCELCRFWYPLDRLGAGECKHPSCGCTKIKQWLATEACPDGRWKRVDVKATGTNVASSSVEHL